MKHTEQEKKQLENSPYTSAFVALAKAEGWEDPYDPKNWSAWRYARIPTWNSVTKVTL
jgi:hypothetical protein